MDVEIIGAPLWQGSGRRGPEKAPKVLVTKEILDAFKTEGITMLDEVESTRNCFPSTKYQDDVMSLCRDLEEKVEKSLRNKHFPLVIGGDHALSIGSIAGIGKIIPPEKLSVVWIDAHTDINTEDTSSSHNIHGMPVAENLGITRMSLNKDGKVNILPENLYYVGVRSIDPPEEEILRDIDLLFKLNS